MNHENPYTLTMQTTAAHDWDEGFEAGRIAERGRLAGEVTDVIDRLAAVLAALLPAAEKPETDT